MRRVWAVGVVLLVAAAAAAWAVWSRQNTATDRDLLSWWTGVPADKLVQKGGDKVLVPPELRPPRGLISRRFVPAPDYKPAPDKPRLEDVVILAGEKTATATWKPPEGAQPRREPISQEQARKIAEAFLRSRGLLGYARPLGSDVAGTDREGKVSLYRFRFRARRADVAADLIVMVDAKYGFVHIATYAQDPPRNISRPPVVTAEEARKKLEECVRRLGFEKWELKRQFLWGREPGFPPGHPVYVFMVEYRRHIKGGGLIGGLCRILVDGIDGRVGRALDFPETKRYERALAEYFKHQLQSRSKAKGK